MFEQWQYAAFGALCTAPVIAVLWSTARGWRLSYQQKAKDLGDAQQWANAMVQGVESQLAHERRLVANLAQRLELIAALETPKGGHASKRMAAIARGEG